MEELTKEQLSQRLDEHAVHIAWAGASNPQGVLNTLLRDIRDFRRLNPSYLAMTQDWRLRAMVGHLAFMFSQALGPDPHTALLLEQHAPVILGAGQQVRAERMPEGVAVNKWRNFRVG